MSNRLSNLEELVQRLRSPDGCPWDREQTMGDLRAYLLEEAHETASAIDSQDRDALEGELGDLLFLVVFVATLAREEGSFDLDSVIDRVHQKMIDRHPHVFTSEKLADADAVRGSWERRKLSESRGSHLEGIPSSLPALLSSYRMTQKAAGVGFDWSAPQEVLDKVEEEVAELREALDSSEESNSTEVAEELGDLLFTMANLARKLKLDPEAALAGANLKFRRRFEHIEASLQEQGRTLDEADLGELEDLWQRAKENGK